MALTNEFKVGLFVLISGAAIGAAYWWFKDGVRFGEGTYGVTMRVSDATGLYKGTPVRLAGVEVGSIEEIEVDGNGAQIHLLIRDGYTLPLGTTGEITSVGMLGDAFIALDPEGTGALQDGSVIQLKREPVGLQDLQRQVQDIGEDVKAITAEVRLFAENKENRENIEATLANINAISEQLRMLTETNRKDINDIVDSVKVLTDNLEAITAEAQGDVDEEMEKLKAATDTLQATLNDTKSITGKIDNGEGTLGALVNERETIDSLNETITNANGLIESFSGMHAKVYYTGRYFVGMHPTRRIGDFPDGKNPLHNSGSNTLGIELHSSEDFWYDFAVVDYPTGVVDYTEHYIPELDQRYVEWTRKPNYRITFQINKRWGPVSFRLGIKEYGGGVGMTFYGVKDRLTISADVFDFDLGSYPAIASQGLPNTRLGVRYEPIDHVYLEAGAEQIALGIKYGYFTGYGGVGFHFDDDDIKLLFATLPLGF